MSDETKIPPQIIEEFKAASKDFCSWQDVADFAEDQLIASAHPIKADPKNPSKMAQEVFEQLQDKEYVNYLSAWGAIRRASELLNSVHHPFPSLNPDLVLEKTFKMGKLQNSISASLMLLDVEEETEIEALLLSNLLTLKGEAPEITMKKFMDVFVDHETPLRPAIHIEIQAIFDGPRSLN